MVDPEVAKRTSAGHCGHPVMSPWTYEKVKVQRLERSCSSAGDFAAVLTDEQVVAVRHCLDCGYVQKGKGG